MATIFLGSLTGKASVHSDAGSLAVVASRNWVFDEIDLAGSALRPAGSAIVGLVVIYINQTLFAALDLGVE